MVGFRKEKLNNILKINKDYCNSTLLFDNLKEAEKVNYFCIFLIFSLSL
jgi:hypothetical protein